MLQKEPYLAQRPMNSLKALSSAQIRRWGGVVLFMLIAAGITLPRVIATGRFVTADEPDWAKRSANFYFAVTHADFPSTYQIEHPGVTTMWLGAAAFHLEFPEYQRYGQSSLGDTKLLLILQRHGPLPLELLATSRLLVALTVSFSLIGGLLYAWRLFPLLAIGLGFSLIALDTFYIGHARVLHTHALLSGFAFVSVMAFLHFLQFRRWHALLVSGLAAGLGLLTVLPGIILLPAIGLITLVDMLYHFKQGDKPRLKTLLSAYALPFLAWVLIAVLVFILLWPAMWVDPAGTLANYARPVLGTLAGSQKLFESIEDVGSTMGTGSNPLLFYVRAFMWRSNLVILLGVLLGLMALILPGAKYLDRSQRRHTLALLIFIVTFWLFMSQVDKKSDRYILPIFPFMCLIAGVGWAALLKWLASRFAPQREKIVLYAGIAVVLVIPLVSTILHFPYYLNYYNPLMGRADEVPDDMFTGWGEGLNEAALYLRDIPDIRDKRIVSWYTQVFNWYSLGLGFQADTMYLGQEASANRLKGYLSSDYVVIYINQWQRNRQRQLLEYLEDLNPVHTVQLNGIDYVKIYKLDPLSASP